jgi:hypothetical protein
MVEPLRVLPCVLTSGPRFMMSRTLNVVRVACCLALAGCSTSSEPGELVSGTESTERDIWFFQGDFVRGADAVEFAKRFNGATKQVDSEFWQIEGATLSILPEELGGTGIVCYVPTSALDSSYCTLMNVPVHGRPTWEKALDVKVRGDVAEVIFQALPAGENADKRELMGVSCEKSGANVKCVVRDALDDDDYSHSAAELVEMLSEGTGGAKEAENQVHAVLKACGFET